MFLEDADQTSCTTIIFDHFVWNGFGMDLKAVSNRWCIQRSELPLGMYVNYGFNK